MNAAAGGVRCADGKVVVDDAKGGRGTRIGLSE